MGYAGLPSLCGVPMGGVDTHRREAGGLPAAAAFTPADRAIFQLRSERPDEDEGMGLVVVPRRRAAWLPWG